MLLKAILFAVCVVLFCSQIGEAASMYFKRAEFEDPRLFSAAFGKRASVEPGQETEKMGGQNYYAIKIQRRSDFEDPRFMSMSFGKRSILPTLDDIHRYAVYDKRGTDIDDPRFLSGAFGRK